MHPGSRRRATLRFPGYGALSLNSSGCYCDPDRAWAPCGSRPRTGRRRRGGPQRALGQARAGQEARDQAPSASRCSTETSHTADFLRAAPQAAVPPGSFGAREVHPQRPAAGQDEAARLNAPTARGSSINSASDGRSYSCPSRSRPEQRCRGRLRLHSAGTTCAAAHAVTPPTRVSPYTFPYRRPSAGRGGLALRRAK